MQRDEFDVEEAPLALSDPDLREKLSSKRFTKSDLVDIVVRQVENSKRQNDAYQWLEKQWIVCRNELARIYGGLAIAKLMVEKNCDPCRITDAVEKYSGFSELAEALRARGSATGRKAKRAQEANKLINSKAIAEASWKENVRAAYLEFRNRPNSGKSRNWFAVNVRALTDKTAATDAEKHGVLRSESSVKRWCAIWDNELRAEKKTDSAASK